MQLRKYQEEAIDWCVAAGKALVCLPVGSGKSTVALHAVAERNTWPLLVVCPASMKYVWAEEILRWYPEWKDQCWIVSNGKETIPPGRRIVLINYDLMSKQVQQLATYGFKAIIGDEASALKDAKSLRSKAFAAVAAHCSTTYLLTATPMMNRPRELIHPLWLIGRLPQFGGASDFARRYCDAKEVIYGGRWVRNSEGESIKVGGRRVWDDSGPHLDGATAAYRTLWMGRLEELRVKLTEEVDILYAKPPMLRMRKADILPELPETQDVLVPVQISNLKEYNAIRKDFSAWYQGKHLQDVHSAIVESDDDLLAEALIAAAQGKEVSKAVEIGQLRMIVGLGKIAPAVQWIEEFLEDTTEKIVVFAHHKEVQEQLIARLTEKKLGVTYLTAEIDSQWRAINIKRFQEDPNCRVIVCGLLVAGMGVTLTAASTCLFVETTYTPTDIEQASGRVNRLGQKASKLVSYFLAAKGTVEERVFKILESKRTVIDTAVGKA